MSEEKEGTWHISGRGWHCNCLSVGWANMRVKGFPYDFIIARGCYRNLDQPFCPRCSTYRPHESKKLPDPTTIPILRDGRIVWDEVSGIIYFRETDDSLREVGHAAFGLTMERLVRIANELEGLI